AQLETGSLSTPGSIAAIVLQKLVVADAGARQQLEINPYLISIQKSARVLEQQSIGSSMDRAECGTLRVVARIVQTKTHRCFRQDGQVVVIHSPCSVHRVRGIVDLDKSIWRIQGIRQEVVIPKVLVAPERRAEVVPLVFVHPEMSSVFRIASPSEAVQENMVEQHALIV